MCQIISEKFARFFLTWLKNSGPTAAFRESEEESRLGTLNFTAAFKTSFTDASGIKIHAAFVTGGCIPEAHQTFNALMTQGCSSAASACKIYGALSCVCIVNIAAENTYIYTVETASMYFNK